MTDVHSHCLYNLDDGSKSIEESIELLKRLKEVGFENVILTPHYIEGSVYHEGNKEKKIHFKTLQNELAKQNIKINIFLGNEIYINPRIDELVRLGEMHTLNNTRYILIELPFHDEIINLEDIIYELKIKGYIPVIAHPERYTYFQENYKKVDHLKKEGFLFQCNFASILGYHRKESEKLVKYMFKKGYVDFLGTDIHSTNYPFVVDNFEEIKKTIIKYIGERNYQRIINNGDKLLKDQKI